MSAEFIWWVLQSECRFHWAIFIEEVKMRHFVLVTLLVLAAYIVSVGLAFADPILIDPVHFRIELYADFSLLAGNPRADGLLFSNGENGFQKGLYVAGGFDRANAPI